MINILIVEDNAHLVRLYVKMLANLDLQVVQATTLKQAFEYLEKHTPDLVILDMGMPDGNGLIILSWLKQNPYYENTKVIVISGESQYENAAERLGIEFFLYKPVSMQALRELIRRILPRVSRS